MNKHLILAALIFTLIGNTIRTFGGLDLEQQWNLWFVYLGMGLMLLTDGLHALYRRIARMRQS
ncbi:MAG TPA: hypothetical protein VF440_09695 [Novosphingobium sp.]